MNITLDTGGPCDPQYVKEVAAAFAEAARVLNHLTVHREALEFPSDADRVIREISSAAGRLPQLLDQIGGWVAAQRAADRIEVPEGEYAGRPDAAAMAFTVRLEVAMVTAAQLQSDIDHAAKITACLAVPPGEGDDGDA